MPAPRPNRTGRAHRRRPGTRPDRPPAPQLPHRPHAPQRRHPRRAGTDARRPAAHRAPAHRGTRRPTGPAGRGPGSSGNHGPTRTPHLTRTTAQRRPTAHPDTPLPSPGARRRAQESRPHLWFAHQLLLTLSGQRPVHVLLGHALPAAYDRLAELAPLSPLRPYVAPGLRAPVPALHECGLCRPRDGVIEAFARITTGVRLRALAFRLERGADTRWRCAALDVGPLPQGPPGGPAPGRP
ncbi:Rv3235 family protein [Streptomyces noursei]|uniref:Rv3235 family protein n=1 Tax=Streptomyces noursei TaxID=1971 RepID=UPI001C936E39|nr:Rv3235 family protein [Streptomyces noursei]